MASGKEYLEFVMEQLSELDGVTYRAMMGEYIIYYRGKVVGGIYDDRLLLKPVKSVITYVSAPRYAVPYPGGKEMLVVDDVDDGEFVAELIRLAYEDLPMPKAKK